MNSYKNDSYKNESPVTVYEKHPTLHNSHLLAIAHCILIKYS